MPTRLNNADYMKFPFSIGAQGAATSTRAAHIREQIEQCIFTSPGERWFRPGFGVGIKAVVFEPASATLVELTKKRVSASLTEALAGEISPNSLLVDVAVEEERLIITVNYKVATINHTERVVFVTTGG